MQLITMAHAGEALSVIESLHLKRTSPEVFVGENCVLLLTGEGPLEAAVKTAALIPLYPFQQIINAGIAGSLKPNLEVGDVVHIRSLYLIKDLKPQFKTFQASDTGIDCLTSFERILDAEKAQMLRGLGGVVDREAWGVAMAAKNAGLPFLSLKVISDRAGSLGACEVVKEKAGYFSELLAEALRPILLTKETNTEERLKLDGFHFTFSMNHQLQGLLKKIAIREETNTSSVLQDLTLDDLRSIEISPKERARLLLNKLEERIDPLKGKLQKMITTIQTEFRKEGIEVLHDPSFEKPSLRLSFEVKNNQELKEFAEKLSKLDLDVFTRSMQGEFHVE